MSRSGGGGGPRQSTRPHARQRCAFLSAGPAPWFPDERETGGRTATQSHLRCPEQRLHRDLVSCHHSWPFGSLATVDEITTPPPTAFREGSTSSVKAVAVSTDEAEIFARPRVSPQHPRRHAGRCMLRARAPVRQSLQKAPRGHSWLPPQRPAKDRKSRHVPVSTSMSSCHSWSR